MIRWLTLKCLGCKEVVILTSVSKDLRNFTFYEDDFKKRLEMTHFKPQKIPSVIYDPLMAGLNIRVFIKIHRKAYFVGKLQEAINAPFQKMMKKKWKRPDVEDDILFGLVWVENYWCWSQGGGDGRRRDGNWRRWGSRSEAMVIDEGN